ncbi:MAG: hypothetical protein PHW01_03000 [Patescibacteria group bacterium]|nr:hypothetical protein [Patescibacteria group bacterium]
MGGAGRVDCGLSNKGDSYPNSPMNYSDPVEFIATPSRLQERVDALEAQVAELTELVKKLQKGEKDEEADLFARTELS